MLEPQLPGSLLQTLAECTGPMDAHMWNAYHIISNRARSVCYATRQQQFRRQTEVAVNQLSRSTLEQMESMAKLGSSQEEIQELAQQSLDTMAQQQGVLMQHQREMLSSHAGLQHRIAENLQHLSREKGLIHAGQEQLTNMTSDIQRQLGGLVNSMHWWMTQSHVQRCSLPCRAGVRHVGPTRGESERGTQQDHV